MFTKGRLLGVVLALFAVICLVVTFDFARGRNPQTASPLLADILGSTRADQCGRDVSELVLKTLPLGSERSAADALVETLAITPPKPWFWTPPMEDSITYNDEFIELLRTVKSTVFGQQLLRLHLSFEDAKVKRVAAEVVCRFD